MTGDSWGASGSEQAGALPVDTSAERLAELAAARPDLWDEIWDHPNCYDGLREWMAAQYHAQQAAEQTQAQVGTASTPWGQQLVPQSAESAQLAQSAPQPGQQSPKKRGKAVPIIASIAAAALVVTGGGTALALTGTLDRWFGGPSAGTNARTAAQVQPTAFVDGAERMWTVDSNQLVTPIVGELGQDFSYLRWAFSRASIALFEANVPAASATAVMLNPRSDESKLVMIDAATGAVDFERDLGEATANCIADTFDAEEAFLCVVTTGASTGSTLLRVARSGEVREQHFDLPLDRASVAEGRIVLAGSERTAIELDRSWNVRWQRADLANGSFAGLDLGADRTLVRGYNGWTLLDGGGQTLAHAAVVGPYDGGDGACDARLTEGGHLFIASDVPCASDASGASWSEGYGFGDNLGGVTVFSAAGEDYVFASDQGGARLLRFPAPGAEEALETVFETSGFGLLVGVTGGDDPLAVMIEDDRVLSVSLQTGSIVAQWPYSAASESNNYAEALVLGDAAVLIGDTAHDPRTGDVLWQLNLDTEVRGGWMTPAGMLVLGGGCPDCSTAGGAYTASTLTLYATAGSGGSSVTIGASGDSAIQLVADEAPGFVPSCPGDTVLLAWMELEDGWIVVCGYDALTPTYVAYRPGGDGTPRFSLGATKPDSEKARSSVMWDPETSRYVATMADGSQLTLDYKIGTATLRDGATHAAVNEQLRFVRYVFVPMGTQVRGIADAAAESGAFNVKAPKSTAEDQIRYMIEVLEKAYEGRAMLKDALPKLAGCTAGPGGYADTVAAMKAVRDNRAELLQALDAMPVDKIPEGKQLLADLTEAITLSHQANGEYVAWAEAANASGCATLSASGKSAADASDAPKERFASRWNSVIAPKYGVRSFDGWYI